MGHDLVDRAKHGDKEAFTALIVPVGDRLYGVAYRILRDADRAEDAVQQTFLIAWRDLASLRDDSRLEAWMFRLLVNACYAEIRPHAAVATRIAGRPARSPPSTTRG